MADISGLKKKRFECDPLADDAVSSAVRFRSEHILKTHELFSTVKELGVSLKEPSCARFLEFYEREPPWTIEWKKCELGRRFFVRNSAFAGLVLMYGSLVFSFTAAFGSKVFNYIPLYMRTPLPPHKKTIGPQIVFNNYRNIPSENEQ